MNYSKRLAVKATYCILSRKLHKSRRIRNSGQFYRNELTKFLLLTISPKLSLHEGLKMSDDNSSLHSSFLSQQGHSCWNNFTPLRTSFPTTQDFWNKHRHHFHYMSFQSFFNPSHKTIQYLNHVIIFRDENIVETFIQAIQI